MEQLVDLEACRICVTCYPLQEMDFIYLFLKNEEFQQELDFIQGEIKQWQLNIEPDDGLPQRICANCFAKFCSIEAFRKECEQTQGKLMQTFMQDQELDMQQMPLVKQELKKSSPIKQEQQQLLTQSDTPLPLVGGNYAAAVNSSLEVDQQVLVPSSADVVDLNDFPVFDQQYDNYDNPALMDSSATLLDNNLIDPATSHELGDFLPSQNLFSFETAEPPSSGTLPLVETEIPSIMDGIMEVTADATNDDSMVKHDLEDILQRSIIPTNATSTCIANNYNKAKAITYTNTRTTNVKDKLKNAAIIKTEVKEMSQQKRRTTPSNKTRKVTQPTQPLVHRERNASDNECDEAHVNRRLKTLPYTCHYCYCPNSGPIDHLSFADGDTLSQHFFDKHDPNRPYNCPQCQYSYKTKRLRDNHVRLTHETGNKTKKCNYCQKILKGAVELHQYNCQHVGDWECSICKEKFPNTPLYRFRLHQRQHDRKNFKCRLCDRTFMRKANLEAHERIHKTEQKLQWQCEQCNTNFNTDYDLRRHKYQHHNDESPVKCKECNQGFSSNAFLQRHMLQIHSRDCSSTDSKAHLKQLQHICLKCNLTFATLEGLQRHMNEASVNNGQCLPLNLYDFKERRRIQRQGVFPCFLCPKRFHLRSQLDKHLNTHDARLRPFQCEQCYVRCRTVTELKQHVDVTHLNIKAFVCNKCGKGFGYKKDLRDHMLFHGEINVYCSEEGCDYACKNDKALSDHIRHKHRLLACEYCHEEFTRQKLTVHLRNVHRTEIDVELAGESDNFYKSQLLNNNNDITQISFNLLNTQATATIAKSTATSSSTSSPPHHPSSSSCGGGGGQTVTATIASSSSSISRSDSSLSTNNNAYTTTPHSPTSINDDHNHQLENEQQQQQQQQLPTIFVTDHNSNNLALNGFITTSNEMNLVSQDDEANMFLVSTAASTTASSSSPSANDNHHQLDQYFMASLMDTEQEIIVS